MYRAKSVGFERRLVSFIVQGHYSSYLIKNKVLEHILRQDVIELVKLAQNTNEINH